MEKRLFIITNDTHYLNVRNYIASHSKGKNFIFILITPFDGYSELLEKIKQDKDVILLEEMFSPKEKKFPHHYLEIIRIIWRIKKLKNKFKKFDKVFFTNYSSWIQHYVLNQYPESKKIYISDGTAVYAIVERRKVDKSILFKGSKLFVDKLLRLKPIHNLHFYSPINLDLPEYDSLELFRYSGSSKAKVNNKKIFFVGGPLVELGKLKDSANREHLRNLKTFFSDQKIHYFAHRREKQGNLDTYSFFDEVKKDDLSFEERLANEQELPSKVISYVSSVLVNLAPVYPQIDFLYIPLKPDDIPVDNEFSKRYSSLKKNFERGGMPNLKELILKKTASHEE